MNDTAPERIKLIDQLVQVNSKSVELMTAITTVGQIGGLANASVEARVNMIENTLGILATAMNTAVLVLKEQEALIDHLGNLLDDYVIAEPVDAEKIDIPGADA